MQPQITVLTFRRNELEPGDTLVWTPNVRQLKIETRCSERRFGWQVPEFSEWNFGLQ